MNEKLALVPSRPPLWAILLGELVDQVERLCYRIQKP